MFSFLSEEYKKIVRNEYKKRILTVFLSFVTISCFVLLLLLTFSYYLSTLESDSLIQQLSAIKNSSISKNRAEIEAGLKVSRSNLVKLSDMSEFSVYDAVRKILSDKNDQIKVTSLSYSAKDGDKKSIKIDGIATNREGLLVFSKQIRQDNFFESFDLPISSYAKDKNINFSIKVLIK